MSSSRMRVLVSAILLSFTAVSAGCGAEGEAADASGDSPSLTAMQTMQTEADAASVAPEAAPEVRVYKSPTCGCCEGWVEHMRQRGYEVTVEDRADLDELKNLLGIPFPLRSCHTAQVGNYLVEGHVPASDVRRLLDESPQLAGIAAPGMPVGSPGMEVPGRAPDRYDVVAFDAEGRTSVFASH